MKQIQCFVTRDGVKHESFGQAKRHAEQAMGNLISTLSHEAVQIDKYVAMSNWIESNIDRFAELAWLKADMKLDQGESEE